LNGLDEDTASRARKYITALASTLRKTRTRTVDTRVTAVNIRRVTDTIERYLQDAEHFLNERRPSTSLASVAYAEGLLDALVFLELTAEEISE
jgi:hypothetical protein